MNLIERDKLRVLAGLMIVLAEDSKGVMKVDARAVEALARAVLDLLDELDFARSCDR